MSARPLYIVAYDICDPARLRRVHDAIRGFSTGGQKSVHECFLSPGEHNQLKRQLTELISAVEDSVVFLRLDPRMGVHVLGLGIRPRDPPFFYAG